MFTFNVPRFINKNRQCNDMNVCVFSKQLLSISTDRDAFIQCLLNMLTIITFPSTSNTSALAPLLSSKMTTLEGGRGREGWREGGRGREREREGEGGGGGGGGGGARDRGRERELGLGIYKKLMQYGIYSVYTALPGIICKGSIMKATSPSLITYS